MIKRELVYKNNRIISGEKTGITLGIIKEFRNRHQYYIDACKEMGTPYEVIDISVTDWIEIIRKSKCDGFLVRPSAKLTIWKQMYDERLKIIANQLNKPIYPSYDEIWMYESKRRMNYWLEANDIPHPKTWIFYSLEEALNLAGSIELPIVYKSDFGSGSSGVKIFHNRMLLCLFVQKCFKRGFVRHTGDRRDRQWGTVIFQEYLKNVIEWRIIKIGKSYFGRQKGKKGNFHSGSGLDRWCNPPKKLLDFAKMVMDKGNFTSMALDIFETTEGKYLVNELQSLFGSYTESQMYINDIPGRYIYKPLFDKWVFEKGIFCQNGSCNLRVETFLEILQNEKFSS